jgi:hypothetical protein
VINLLIVSVNRFYPSQLSAQRSDFVEYLLQLQYVTEPLHQYIVNLFAEARAELSLALTDLNDEGVHEITEGEFISYLFSLK